MAIQTLYDTGASHSVQSRYDGGTYSFIPDHVCGGIGDNFNLTYSASNLDISFAAGSQAIIGGSFFKVTSINTITLAANSTIYLVANINLSNPNGSIGSFQQRTASNIRHDILNGSGTSRDLLLYVITTGATGVTNVEDKRLIVNESVMLFESDYESLTTKQPYTIYDIFEN